MNLSLGQILNLQTIDIGFAGREIHAVIRLQRAISAEHGAIIAPELVRIDETGPAGLLTLMQQSFAGTLGTTWT
jgi:hypothetical protein